MYFCSMERRIKFIYGLTICAIVAYTLVQGYWLYSRYQLSLDEYKSELYDTIIACFEEDIAVRKALPSSPRLYGNRFRKAHNQKDDDKTEAWTCEIIAFDTLHHSLVIPKDVDAPTYLLEFIANHGDTQHLLLETLDRFIVDLQHPFQKERLDSILRSRDIAAQSIITTKTDTMIWQPSMQTKGSIWQPVMQVSYPYDIFEGQGKGTSRPLGRNSYTR